MKFIVAALAAFVAFAAATPIVRRDTVVHCGRGTGGDIDVTHILSQVQSAPREDRSKGYPHQFKNYEGLPMSSACASASKMLELPVFADGHPYNLAQGEQPGAVRAIYSIDDNALCAIVAHDNNDSNFHECN
ncbi:hypothetical protein MVES_000747 [Malassezia vespertilionis]|uniref:Uncharacterized protein n=1 Tax=Malassezia vespertilionis TaxID=2020962 RepID=A0A2N1JEQ4_9BASI|nr:hypothetical protein MVES_000747 [Malassezia vespertilionis]